MKINKLDGIALDTESFNYLIANRVYMNKFGIIPSNHKIYAIDHGKCQLMFKEKFAKEIVETYSRSHTETSQKDKLRYKKHTYLFHLKNEILVEFGTPIVLYYQNDTNITQYENFIESFLVKSEKETKISLIISGRSGLETKSIVIKENKLDYLNYNKEFDEIDKQIKENLNTDRIGVYLFYGAPGGGKTSYIRHLAGAVDKRFLVVSSVFLGGLDSPEFTTLLLDNPNTVLVIEDAERLLMSREDCSHSAVSALLNLSDGLIGQAINLQIICSFNTDFNKIDSALTRKGRLIKAYEFKKLEIDRAKQLADQLKKEINITEPMSIADIYNYEEEAVQIQKKRAKIGFAAV